MKGASLIKHVVEKLFAPNVFKKMFEYYVLNPVLKYEEDKFLNFSLLVIEEIINSFFNETIKDSKKLQNKIRKILNEEFVPDDTSILSVNEYFKSLKNELVEKGVILKNLYSIISIRKGVYEQYLNRGAVSKSNKVIVSTELPSLIFQNILIPEEYLFKYFGFSTEDINRILKNPTEFINLENIKEKEAEISLILKGWKSLVNIKELLMKYESTVLNFEYGNFKSLNDIFKKINDFKFEIQNIISQIELGNFDENSISDKFLLMGNEEKEEETNSLEQITKFVSENYKLYETGWLFWDIPIRGFETGSIYLLAAPSSHGKTMFLINAVKKFIESNLSSFEENDGILFVTLEDNKFKLTRRIISIFGNYNFEHVKRFYDNIAALSNMVNKYFPELAQKHKKEISDIFKTLKKNSIYKITKNKVNLIIRDVTDKQNKYSVTDLIQDIEHLKSEYGINIKLVVIDYLNLMTSTKGYDDEYKEHGQIINDLRSLAKMYMIPVFTATQLNRIGEDYSSPLNNKIMGDSYKKIQYSDYIFMIRKTEPAFSQSNDFQNEEEQNNKKKSKNRKINVKSISDFLLDTGLNTNYISNDRISKLIDKIIVESNLSNFNLDNLQRKLTKIEKKIQEIRNKNFVNLNDSDDEFDLFTAASEEMEHSSEKNYDVIVKQENKNINHIFSNSDDIDVIQNVISLSQFSFTKIKDSGQPINEYTYSAALLDKIKSNPEIAKKIEIDFKHKRIIIDGVPVHFNIIVQYAGSYILYNKFNNRFYDIYELPFIYEDINDSILKLRELNKMIESLTVYQKVKEYLQ